MSDVFGHHHQPTGGPGRSAHHDAGASHQRQVSGGPAPGQPQLSFTVQPAALASEPLRRRRPDTNLSWTIGAFLVPDDDPWRRERWRRLGEKPDPGAT